MQRDRDRCSHIMPADPKTNQKVWGCVGGEGVGGACDLKGILQGTA